MVEIAVHFIFVAHVLGCRGGSWPRVCVGVKTLTQTEVNGVLISIFLAADLVH